MNHLTILGIAVGLAMDAFAVAIVSSIALGRVSSRQIFRLAFHFGLFQALMPIAGWLAGNTLRDWVSIWDHWIAFGLLAFVGLKSIYEALFVTKEAETVDDPTRGLKLLALSTAVSIDALAVGLSFAALEVQVLYPALMAGLVTCVLSIVGMLLGSRLGMRFGRRLEVLGGVLLILIGLRILLSGI